MEKKKKDVCKRNWATAQLYCEKKNFVLQIRFVLQEEGWLQERERKSQYKNCIVTRSRSLARNCIAIGGLMGWLYCKI